MPTGNCLFISWCYVFITYESGVRCIVVCRASETTIFENYSFPITTN